MKPISEYPERIVCLTEETTETLYLLGEDWRIVGISGFTVRPPRARREKPRVSAFTSANTARILELRPDLVLGFSDLQADIGAQLTRAGLEVHLFNQRSIEEILRMIRTLGGMLGCEARARALAAGLAHGLDEVRARAAALTRRPRVYFEEWDAPMISGIRWVSELIELAGGEDCFPELARESLARNRIIADAAEVPRRAPDIVLGSWCGKKFRPEQVAARPGWSAVPAVRTGFVREIKSALILQPGPAALTDGVRAVSDVIAEWGAQDLTNAARGADQLPGFDDLLRALLGVRQHRLREPVGLELVWMVAVQLSAVGLEHLGIAGICRCAEHAVGFLQPPVALRRAAGAARLLAARLATGEGGALDAQHRLDLRQLESAGAEGMRDAAHERAHRSLEVVTGERGTHLDLDEHPQNVRPPAAGALELAEVGAGVELRVLAGGKERDGLADLRFVEAQLGHHGARRGDFLLRHPAVGFGEIAHHAKGGLEEALADQRHVRRGRAGGVRLVQLVELVPDQDAERGADRPERQHSEQPAGQLAHPLHARHHLHV